MDHFLGQEVFVVTGAEEDEISDLFVTNSRLSLDEHLLQMAAATDSDTRVFHGVLATAEFIPASFHGKSTFIICLHPHKTDEGYVGEGPDNPGELVIEVEAIINSTGLEIPGGKLSIDHLYILYGYQLKLALAINEDEVDEEYIFTCSQIYDDTIEVESQFMENGGK